MSETTRGFEMNDYPPYACSCCGVANDDMFYDYYQSLGREPSQEESTEFKYYKKFWYKFKEERAVIKQEAFRSGRVRKQSEETRAKISATIRAKKSAHTNQDTTPKGGQ